ncbi:probable E3 ubiquitin-protein ligase RNF217 [Tanacetum coccineum]
MIKYIQAKLDDNVSDIKCPHESCNHSLEPLSCGTKISHKLFNRWCDALCESTVLGFDLVYCPNKECSELIMNEFSDGDVKRCVCPSCLKPFCYQCKAPWHDGYTCEETRDGNNVDFEVVCKKNRWNWKRCPKYVGPNFATSAEKKYHFGVSSSSSICVAQPMTMSMIFNVRMKEKKFKQTVVIDL